MRYPAVCTGTFLASRTMLLEPADYVTIGKYVGCSCILRHKDTTLPTGWGERGTLAGDSMGASILHVPAILAAIWEVYKKRDADQLLELNRQR